MDDEVTYITPEVRSQANDTGFVVFWLQFFVLRVG